ncbi:MAG: hypothetical protein LBN02_03800 [Oscillospiraceae bacterium]|jgi:hypothetical protein|nr:hypothetical protein [Oscillospiraceae bacterium]
MNHARFISVAVAAVLLLFSVGCTHVTDVMSPSPSMGIISPSPIVPTAPLNPTPTQTPNIFVTEVPYAFTDSSADEVLPTWFQEDALSKSYAVGPMVEITFSNYEFHPNEMSVRWEIHYPHIYTPHNDEGLAVSEFCGDIRALNIALREAAMLLAKQIEDYDGDTLSDNCLGYSIYGLGFIGYNILSADETSITVRYAGAGRSAGQMRQYTYNFTIDLVTGETMSGEFFRRFDAETWNAPNIDDALAENETKSR